MWVVLSSFLEKKMILSDGLSAGKEPVTCYWASLETTSTNTFLVITLPVQLLLATVVV